MSTWSSAETAALASELTSERSRRGGAAKQGQTPKRSQAESGLWSHRAGLASQAAFQEPSPPFFVSSQLWRWNTAALVEILFRPRAGRIACHIEAAPPARWAVAPNLQVVEWCRRRWSSPSATRTDRIGLTANRWCAAAVEPCAWNNDSDANSQGLGRAHSTPSITDHANQQSNKNLSTPSTHGRAL